MKYRALQFTKNIERYRSMSYSEYKDLAPIDNVENGDEYFEALNWAFKNKKVKNIAIDILIAFFRMLPFVNFSIYL